MTDFLGPTSARSRCRPAEIAESFSDRPNSALRVTLFQSVVNIPARPFAHVESTHTVAGDRAAVPIGVPFSPVTTRNDRFRRTKGPLHSRSHWCAMVSRGYRVRYVRNRGDTAFSRRSRATGCGGASSESEEVARLGGRRDGAFEFAGDARGPFDELCVALGEFALPVVDVVLHADADVSAHRHRHRRQG